MPLMRSWLASANHATTDFPLNNLPCGVFSAGDGRPRCGVAIGDQVLDVAAMEAAGLLRLTDDRVLDAPSWNKVMALGPGVWQRLRIMLLGFLVEGTEVKAQVEPFLVAQSAAQLHLPLNVTGLTEFQPAPGGDAAGEILPLGLNGRAAGVVVSGTAIRRPSGPRRQPGDNTPSYGATQQLDFTAQLGSVIGTVASGAMTADRADAMIFGHVLVNGWIARDIAREEADGSGLLLARAAGTTISPWIVMAAALAPFRRVTTARGTLPPHLHATRPLGHDIALSATVTPAAGGTARETTTTTAGLAFAPAQQLAQLTNAGFPVTAGEMLTSGDLGTNTADGAESWLADGDRVELRGHCDGDGYRIGFGACSGRIMPA